MTDAMDDVFCEERLRELFPERRTGDFFNALYGGAEEGAYDIRLAKRAVSEQRLEFLFELRQRPRQCLACSLTHGLPHVFARHPVINVKGLAAGLASLAGWPDGSWTWELGATGEISDALHVIPFTLTRNAG
jgi:hypothetical protein